jgi:hypothetical protein
VRDYHLLHNEILRQGKIIFRIARLD